MSWLDEVGQGLTWAKDKLEKGAEKTLDMAGNVVQAATAPVGLVYDLTTYALPGDQWGSADDNGFSGLLDHLGGRALDVADPLGLGYDSQLKAGFGKTMEGLSWLYHEGVDQPLSTAMTMASHVDADGWGELFNGDAWAQAYSIAEHQTFGQSVTYAVSNDRDPLADVTAEGTPFENVTARDHPFLARAAALGIDLAASWYLDPAVVAGTGLGVARNTYALGAIKESDRAHFGDLLDGASLATSRSELARQRSTLSRVDSFIEFAHANRMNGAEIRQVFPELKRSPGGRQLSSLLGDATKISDPVDRGNAVRRILAIGAGDVSQIGRLRQQVASAEATADVLANIVRKKTVDLADQALNKALVVDPTFRLGFNQQLMAIDHGGDLTKAAKTWHAQLASQLADDRSLLDAAGTLDFVPSASGLASKRRLTSSRGETGLNLGTVERAHDAVVAKSAEAYRRFTRQDGYSTVYQGGLSSVPLIVAYPAKMMANASPTKLIPAAVRGLGTVHLNGFVNTHDWNGAVDQLDSMMKLGGVSNEERLGLLSEAMRFGSGEEAAKIGMINRVEHATVNALATRLTEKFGIEVDADFIKQSMLDGQYTRRAQLGAFGGGRQYASSTMQSGRLVDEETALTFKGEVARRRANANDQALADESADVLGQPRVDLFDDATGAPVAMPLVTTQLANRIPLFDIERANKLASDKAYVERLSRQSDMWRDAATELEGLRASLKFAKGSEAARVKRRIQNVRMTQDWLLGTASAFNHAWKMSVLFRLGYPMRVIADDHLRIASKFGYMHFVGANLTEAVGNTLYNHLPGGALRNTRKGQAKLAQAAAKQRRSELRVLLGREHAHTDAEWSELNDLNKVWTDGVSSTDEKTAAASRLRELDPSGYVQEYLELQSQAARLQRQIGGHRGAIKRWGAADDVGNAGRIAAAREKIAERQGELDQVLMQLDGVQNPDELRRELLAIQQSLRGGSKAFREDKRHLGSAPVALGGRRQARGAFEGISSSYREASSSSATFNAVISDGEENLYNALASGHFRTVSPEDPGYYQLWSNIVNHQFQHSPEFMSIIKGEVRSPEEFAKWLAKPEQRHVRERVPHFAANPEDWGGRLLAVVQDYIPTQALQDLVAQGRVSTRELKRMFPRDAARPVLHGQLADMQSGRIPGVRAFANGINSMFRYLSEVPTDRLSRHPYFNALYKREVKAAYRSRVAQGGAQFGQADLDAIEALARKRALADLKNTLWDVSSHSHAAHVMRFISPFFAAHQEALTRWWEIAKDRPDVVRKWQLAFDAPRRAGLVTDENGNPVPIGEAVGPNHRIMLRLPFAGDNNPVNEMLREIGGDKYWSVDENGFNIVLQSGVTNPGVGPFVTIPLEGFVQKYAESDRLEKAARILNAYPPNASGFKDIAINQLTPPVIKRFIATRSPEDNAEYFDSYMRNYADGLISFKLAHDGREPGRNEEKEIRSRAKDMASRDLWLRAISNATFFTPAMPNSKFAAVQDGLNRLREQQRREGHDYDWLRDAFAAKWGEAYLALLYSENVNPAGLDGTKSEVMALKDHRTLLDQVSPRLTSMVIGPEVAEINASNPDLGVRSAAVRGYLRGQAVSPGSQETYYSTKSLDEASQDLAAQSGWDMYRQLSDYLQDEADQKGLLSYEQDPNLRAQRAAGLRYIRETNPAFADVWDSFTPESYEAQVDDMRIIATDPKLAADPLRQSEMYWLNQYLILRDQIQQMLNERIAAGGAKTITNSPNGENADLARMMRAGVDYILSQSENLRRYAYVGLIERDPYLALPSEYDAGR